MQLFLSEILFLSQDTGSEVGKNASGFLTTMTLIPMQNNISLLFNWEKSYCIFEPFFTYLIYWQLPPTPVGTRSQSEGLCHWSFIELHDL